MQYRCERNRNIFFHASIHMYTEYIDAGTAIRFATAAGNAGAAMKIGNDGNGFIFFKSFRIYHFQCKLMTQYARIIEERLRAFIRMQVGAADTNTFNAKKSLSRCSRWFGHYFIFEFAGLYADE